MSFIDIVMPKNNEKEFIEIAEKLGFKVLVFLYRSDKKDLSNMMSLLKSKTKLKLYTGIIVKELNKARGLKKKYDLLFGYTSKSAAESKIIDVLFDQESSYRRDFMHSRNSGFNQVLAKECKQKKKILAFDFNLLLTKPEQQEVIIGRFMQNIELQRKYKFSAIIASFARDPYQMRHDRDLMAFLISSGMNAGDAKRATDLLSDKL
jgi:RNase P/RNase MRP subunit p30